MAKSAIVWEPGKSPRDLAAAIQREYGVSRHVAAAGVLAKLFAPKMEKHAKIHAPWQNQTGNARSGLFALVEIEKERVILYLSHGMEYGVFLELCNAGKYAIIMKTLQAYYPHIKKAMQDQYR